MKINVEFFEIDGWEDQQTGIIVAENNDWLLVKHIPVDFVIDGYSLYNKKYVAKRSSGKDEKRIERVTKLKGVAIEMPEGFEFADTVGLLKWSEEKFGLFSFQMDDDNAVFFGQVNRVEKNLFVIDFVYSDGKIEVDYDFEFDLDEIRAIAFGNDYFESIRLLYFDENKIK